MKHLTRSIAIAGVLLSGGPGFADRVTILTRPENVTLSGDPNNTWVVNTSRPVPGEAGGVYRGTVEIRSQINSGSGNVTIRQIAEDGRSISYQGIGSVSPPPLDFTTHTRVFIAHGRTMQLQAYYRLNRASGTATFRHLTLEKLTGADAREALREFDVPLVHFSLPVYRYLDDTELEWGFRINARLNRQAPKVDRVQITCAGRRFFTPTAPAPNQWIVETANLTLPRGTQEMKARALDRDGNVLAERTTRIRSIPRPVFPNHLPITRVEIDGRNNLRVNGEPIFPMGLYHVYTREQMRQIRRQGFNCIQVWGESPEHFRQMLDWTRDEQLMSWTVTKMVDDDYLKKLVTLFKDHPAHLMWDLVDEPAIRNFTPQQVRAKAQIIRAIDPDHPIKISFADRHRAVEYRDSLDIAASHTYPMPNGRVTRMGDAMKALASSFQGAVPHHASPQAWMTRNDMRHIEQTVAQTRAMTYLAIVHGAKGLYYYSFIDHGSWDLRRHPRLWSTFKGLTWEIQSLAKILLEGRRVPHPTVSDPAVQDAAWEHESIRYLIAVNTSDEPLDARLDMQEPGAASGSFVLTRMFEDDPQPTAAGAGGRLRFAPLQTLVLKMEPAEPSDR